MSQVGKEWAVSTSAVTVFPSAVAVGVGLPGDNWGGWTGWGTLLAVYKTGSRNSLSLLSFPKGNIYQ